MTQQEMIEKCGQPSPSNTLLVLHTLIEYERKNLWLTLEEIGTRTALSSASAGSRLRDLRVAGFNVKRARRIAAGSKRVWEYKLFSRTPQEIEEANGFRSA